VGDVLNALATEYIKLRKTFVVWVILLTPLVLNGLFFLVGLKVEELSIPDTYGDGWQWLIVNLSMFWSLMLLPMLIALVVGLVNYYEHAANSWKHLFALPVRREAIIAAKFIVCQAVVLASSLLIWGLTIAEGLLLRLLRPGLGFETAPPVWAILERLLEQYLAVGLILAILFFVAVRFHNIAVTIGVGIAGTFVGMVNATGWFQKLFPWKLASNTQAAIEGVPEIALAVGCGGGLLLAVAVTLYLARRDVVS